MQNDKMVNDVTAAGFESTYWRGDLFECPVCGAEIVVGFGREISAERLQEIGFAANGSLTFAYEPQQLEKYADQFCTQSEADRV